MLGLPDDVQLNSHCHIHLYNKKLLKTNNDITTIGRQWAYSYILMSFALCAYFMRVSKTQTRACLTRRRVLHAHFGPHIFDLYCTLLSIFVNMMDPFVPGQNSHYYEISLANTPSAKLSKLLLLLNINTFPPWSDT